MLISSTEGARAVEYVRVCSIYGAGFWYIPGTDICIKTSTGFAGGFNRTSVNNAWFMSTDTLAAIPERILGVDSSNTSSAVGYLNTTYIPLFAPPKTPISINGKPVTLEQAGLTQAGVDALIKTGWIKEMDDPPPVRVDFPTTFPQGTGFVKDPPTSTMPLLGGLSIPAWWFGLGWPQLTFEIMGGVNFNHRTASIALASPAPAPAGSR